MIVTQPVDAKNLAELTTPAYNYYIKQCSGIYSIALRTDGLGELAKHYLDREFLKQGIFVLAAEDLPTGSTFTQSEHIARRLLISAFLVTCHSLQEDEETCAKLTIGIFMAYYRKFHGFLPDTQLSDYYYLLSCFFGDLDMRLISHCVAYITRYEVEELALVTALRELGIRHATAMFQTLFSRLPDSPRRGGLEETMTRILEEVPPPFDLSETRLYVEVYGACQGESHLIHFKNNCVMISPTGKMMYGKQVTPINLHTIPVPALLTSKLTNPRFFETLDGVELTASQIPAIDRHFREMVHEGTIKEYLIIPVSDAEVIILYSHAALHPLDIRGLVI